MCRLYGLRASEATKVECSLVYAQNALLQQSRGDLRGERHPDGWGICCYENSLPVVERRDTAAHADAMFSRTAERVYARTVIAHVRAATVGAHDLSNTHPFVHGHWAFAHNGTLRGFDRIRPWMEAETGSAFLALKRGQTDSEAAFYFLLARATRWGIDLERPCADADAWLHVLDSVMRELDRRCAAAEPQRPARLNFLITDGNSMFATRWRNSLSWVYREGLRDCEICGIPHVHHRSGHRYRAVAVASEPITHEPWREVPEAGILHVNGMLDARVHAA